MGYSGPGVFMKTYKVYSSAFIGREDLKKGNKIILPTSALSELAHLKITYPMTFRVVNPQLKKKTYCGVLEFIAEEGCCYMPYWMMENLLIGEEDEILITSVSLQKGTHIELQPHKTAFIDLSNPKAILETELTNYSCLMEGDTINIHYQGFDFLIDVVKWLPDKQICVVEADLNVEFKAPKDYKEAPKMSKKKSKLVVSETKIKEQKFDEKYARVDGKKLTKKQKEKLYKKFQEDEKEANYNPRTCRLKHGIKNYDERMRKRKEGIYM